MDERTQALIALAENERTREVARFGLLRPHLEDGVPLAMIVREQELTLRTLERWVARYRSKGRAGLARRKRTDSRSYRVPDSLQLLIDRTIPNSTSGSSTSLTGPGSRWFLMTTAGRSRATIGNNHSPALR